MPSAAHSAPIQRSESYFVRLLSPTQSAVVVAVGGSTVHIELHSKLERCHLEHSVLSFLKNRLTTIVTKDIPMRNLIQVSSVTTGGFDSLLDQFQNYIQHTMEPSLIDESGISTTDVRSTSLRLLFQSEGESDASLKGVKKKMQELLICVKVAQESSRIPAIHIESDGMVKRLLAENNNEYKDALAAVQKKGIDNGMLNKLQNDVTIWSNEITKLTSLLTNNTDYGSRSPVDEKVYWESYHRAMIELSRRLSEDDIYLQIGILNLQKRCIRWLVSNGVKEGTENVYAIHKVLSDIPVEDISSCTSFLELHQTIKEIFQKLKQIHNVRKIYPYKRCVDFMLSVSQEMTQKIISGGLVPTTGKSPTMNSALKDLKNIFNLWDDEWRNFNHTARVNLKSDGIMATPDTLPNIKYFSHTAVRNRIEAFQRLKRDYNKIASTDAGELSKVIEPINSFNIMDLSDEGENRWKELRDQFDEAMDRYDDYMSSKLRAELEAASGPSMFQVFNENIQLLDRPRIRAAVKDSQVSLLSYLHQELKDLNHEFSESRSKFQSSKSSDHVSGRVKGVPDSVDRIEWLLQLDDRLDICFKRMVLILGERWEETRDGADIRLVIDALRREMDLDNVMQHWLELMKKKVTLNLNAQIFEVYKNDEIGLRLSLTDEDFEVYRAIRFISTNRFKIPYKLKIMNDVCRELFPMYCQLRESLHTLRYIETELETQKQMPEQHDLIVDALAIHYSRLQDLIEKGLMVSWESVRASNGLVSEFTNCAIDIETSYLDITRSVQRVDSIISRIELLPLTEDIDAFRKLHMELLDELSVISEKGIVRIAANRLMNVVRTRINELATLWTKEFNGETPSNRACSRLTVSILLRNRKVIFEPCATEIYEHWYNDFHHHLSKLLMFSDKVSFDDRQMLEVYSLIDGHAHTVKEYLDRWKSYNILWEKDLQAIVSERGGTNELSLGTVYLQVWKELDDVKKTKVPPFRSHGPTSVNTSLIRHSVDKQVDKRHGQLKDLVKDFLKVCEEKIRDHLIEYKDSLENVKKLNQIKLIKLDGLEIMRSEQEAHDFQSILDTLASSLTLHKTTKARILEDFNVVKKNEQIETLIGERGNLLTEIMAYKSLNDAQSDAISQKMSVLKEAINISETSIQSAFATIKASWEHIRSEKEPEAALEHFAKIEKQEKSLRECLLALNRARESLGFPQIEASDKFDELHKEVEQMKQVWGELNEISLKLREVRDTEWSGVIPRRIRERLEGLLESLKKVNADTKQFDTFHDLQDKVKFYLSMNGLLNELKGDYLNERHWEKIAEMMGMEKGHLSDLRLGDVYECALLQDSKELKDLLKKARGERSVELFLKEVGQAWNDDMLFKLSDSGMIVNFDEIYTKLDEHLQLLDSMKASAYYDCFKEQGKLWEEKLTKIRLVLAEYELLQKSTIYLNSIKDVTIPAETKNLLKRVVSLKKPIELLQLELKSLQKSNEQLNSVKKSLVLFLEQKRNQFSRLYFIGDDDLLQIISQPLNLLNKHITKMFPGISHLDFDQNDPTLITGLTGNHNDALRFLQPVKMESKNLIQSLKFLQEQITESLKQYLIEALKTVPIYADAGDIRSWLYKYPSQLVILATQITFTSLCDSAIANSTLPSLRKQIQDTLQHLTESGLGDHVTHNIITELIHQTHLLDKMISNNVTDVSNYLWNQQLRFYVIDGIARVRIASYDVPYAYEYIGTQERLVQTPLTDQCILTMTQALHMRLAGNPYGPAGTGKTETIKYLAQTLGLLVLVFNCDEAFDFCAMNRIFTGLAEVGAWGCFDEFNRLHENILSALSQQILMIQTALRNNESSVQLLDTTLGTKSKSSSNNVTSVLDEFRPTQRTVNLNPLVGIFVTMNPGYAGRSQLPDNLKQLIREFAMIVPEKTIIAEVQLYSRGFKNAPQLAPIIIGVFEHMAETFSQQPHYDFGLRALKCVLDVAGTLRRLLPQEKEVVILKKSITDTVLPQLVGDDIDALDQLLRQTFPEVTEDNKLETEEKMRECVVTACKNMGLRAEAEFANKVIQTYNCCASRAGIMLVGETGSGKTCAIDVLLAALDLFDGKASTVKYTINPKALKKEELFGSLDSITLEWNDGVLTTILRKIQDTDPEKRHFIVFDGNVDPGWAENLNSVLDDNRLLTLPNGERFKINNNVKLLFETDTLQYATPASITRCGIVYVTPLSPEVIITSKLDSLKQLCQSNPKSTDYLRILKTTLKENPQFLIQAMSLASKYKHVMPFTAIRALESLFLLLRHGAVRVADSTEEVNINQVVRSLLIYVLWSFGGDLPVADKHAYADELQRYATNLFGEKAQCPDGYQSVLLNPFTGEWQRLSDLVAAAPLEESTLANGDSLIETSDTITNRRIIRSLLDTGGSFILCGPPGSGKTMTLSAVLHNDSAQSDVAMLNFSNATTPETLIKTFHHYCDFIKTSNGVTMRPKQDGKRLIIFADEVNLPQPDEYNDQHVVSLMRQIVSTSSFWMCTKGVWERVKVERIVFAGACNPPEDAGRHRMSDRLLRLVPVLFIDFPGPESLHQIYSTFNKRLLPNQASLADKVTKAMVEFYLRSQSRFNSTQQPHYIYSPRELTRWRLGINEGLRSRPGFDLSFLVRLAIHEGERVFCDKLVLEEERRWSRDQLIDCFSQQFGQEVDYSPPFVFTCLYSGVYEEVEEKHLIEFLENKMDVYCEEESTDKLVLFNGCLEHILRIDRVLRQPLGHLLLVGVSGVGKNVLTKFTAWLQGMSIFEIRPSHVYDLEDFEDDLRGVMKRSGVKGEKITFIFDESNVFSPGFLERMNALLASGEVPGLFEQELLHQLLAECRSTFDHGVESDETELFSRFTSNVRNNLHIVFTMNPCNPDFYNRKATSPALFNRCVIDWFGDWNKEALLTIATEYIRDIPLDTCCFVEPIDDDELKQSRLITAILNMHSSVKEVATSKHETGQQSIFISPREYLDFLRHLMHFSKSKRVELTETENHLVTGLSKLQETEAQIEMLQRELNEKFQVLGEKQELSKKKMTDMVAQKQQAETKKADAEALANNLDVTEAKIRHDKKQIEEELAEVKPLLDSAKQEVTKINKQDIAHVRSMGNPAEISKLVIRALCIMLLNEEREPEWDECRKILQNEPLKKMESFDTFVLKPGVITKLRKSYLSHPDWVHDRIASGSSECQGIAIWVENSIKYAEVAVKVAPLNTQIKSLERAIEKNRSDLAETHELIATLEAKLAVLQSEYGELIAQEQVIKKEIDDVTKRINVSRVLITNLSSEQERWSKSSAECKNSYSTEIGDSLLAAIFCTYLGFFDQSDREHLIQRSKETLESSHVGIRYNTNWTVVEYLSDSRERFNWVGPLGLPNDQLSLENACILKHHIRYPLIIDPANQMIDFIAKKHDSAKVLKTYATHPQFVKHLESAVRFGNVLIIQDMDSMLPVLAGILNKDTKMQNGRLLINVGGNELDLSPNFSLYMTTANREIVLTPDFSSRTTIVNCSVTPSSLKNQSISSILRSERPSVDKKRREVLKLQGEYRVILRELEDKLLSALSTAKGSILDNDTLISTLDDIKAKSRTVAVQASQADQVYEEISSITHKYIPLAESSTKVYTMLNRLKRLHWLYKFDVELFERIFNDCLSRQQLAGDTQENDSVAEDRVQMLMDAMFLTIYRVFGLSLFYNDRLVLALELAKIKWETLNNKSFESLPEAQLLCVKRKEAEALGTDGAIGSGNLSELTTYPGFAQIKESLNGPDKAEWSTWLRLDKPETVAPPEFSHEPVSLLRRALLIKVVRPDRFVAALLEWSISMLGSTCVAPTEFSQATLVDLINRNIISSKIPVLLVAAPGFEPSHQVLQAAKAMHRECHSIALGSPEGYTLAEDMLSEACAKGHWIILKNVHLVGKDWLEGQFKKCCLKNLKRHDNFRLFMTSTFKEECVPSEIVSRSMKFLFESPKGLKTALSRTWQTHVVQRTPVSTNVITLRLYFLATLLHSILLERGRFVPLGWTKPLDFSDADMVCFLDIVMEWLSGVTQVKNIPWKSIQTLVTTVVYGGKIDNPKDYETMKTLVEKILCDEMLSEGHPILINPVKDQKNVDVLKTPELSKDITVYTQWISDVASEENPEWIGLPADAEVILAKRLGNTLSGNWAMITSG